MNFQFSLFALISVFSVTAFAQTGGGTSVGKTYFVSPEASEETNLVNCKDFLVNKTGIDPFSVEYYFKDSQCSEVATEHQQSNFNLQADGRM